MWQPLAVPPASLGDPLELAMVTRIAFTTAALLLAVSSKGHAQSAGNSPSPEAPDPNAAAVQAEPPPAVAPAPLPPPADRSAADYDRAFAAFTSGDLPTAILGFDQVGRTSGELAASARELARLARALQVKQVRFVVSEPGGPNSTVTTRRVYEEDDKNSGRFQFVAGTTFAGLYAGITLTDLTNVDDFRTGMLIIVGATGAGFMLSLFGTSDTDIRSGVADGYTSGLTLGLANGLLLAPTLEDESSEQILGIGLGAMVVGGGVGYFLAKEAKPTSAQVQLVSLGSTIGFATAGLGMLVLDSDGSIDGDSALLILTAGLDAGALGATLTVPKLDWSKSRARAVGLGTILGGLVGFGAGALIIGDPEGDGEARVLAATALGGIWGGLALSIRLSRGMKPDPRYSGTGSSLSIVPTTSQNGGRGLALGGRF